MAITKTKMNIVMRDDLKFLITKKAEALGYGEREVSKFVRSVLKNVSVSQLEQILKNEDRVSA